MCKPDIVDRGDDEGVMTTSSSSSPSEPSCCESISHSIDQGFYKVFYAVGKWVGYRPITTIFLSLLLTIVCGTGIMNFTTENRGDKLWVPQNTVAEVETDLFLSYFPKSSRFNQVILTAGSGDEDTNMLTKDNLLAALNLHRNIQTGVAVNILDETNSSSVPTNYTYIDLCTRGGGDVACVSNPINPFNPICSCFVSSILRLWDYNLGTLEDDDDVLGTIQSFYPQKDEIMAIVGGRVEFDTSNETDASNTTNPTVKITFAEAISITYFLVDRSVEEDGNLLDPINSAWERDVFLDVIQNMDTLDASLPSLNPYYFAGVSFEDEFGEVISGDLLYVQVSYLIVFIFLGATLGTSFFCCGGKNGSGSRWSMSLSALFLVGFSTLAGIGVSSALGLIYGPVHSLLPFVLLGIGVDDSFVITNAFDLERKKSRQAESKADIVERAGTALARSGTSITVTSATDVVAFAISSASALPALGSFCAYAAISVFFLWFFSATFYTACLVIDEQRQRDNRYDILCCFRRRGVQPLAQLESEEVEGEQDARTKNENETDNDYQATDGYIQTYFYRYHAPAILSAPGKIIVLIVFSGLFAYGLFGAANLSVEDSSRNFVPADSYLKEYLDATDLLFASSGGGTSFFIVFENNDENSLYTNREALANLGRDQLSGLSSAKPYIAEPTSMDTYRNVYTGLKDYLQVSGTSRIGNVTLGPDNWPLSYEDFITTLDLYTSSAGGPGAMYRQDLSIATPDNSTDLMVLNAYKVELQYVPLNKRRRGGDSPIIADANKQIEAMDSTRNMIKPTNEMWSQLQPAFVYSPRFIEIESFKVIKRELFVNVGCAIGAVAVIVLLTVANFRTTCFITLCVTASIVEILGFMYALGIVIDSVSVINIVLAVGLSVDYSAHIGHCFMVKGGTDKNKRAAEALHDIGSSVFSGAFSTFLAVAVLFLSSSYVFETLSKQFALTVVLGAAHGLILLPVLLALFGPPPFSSAMTASSEVDDEHNINKKTMDRMETRTTADDEKIATNSDE